MSKKVKIILGLLGLFLIVGFVSYNYIMKGGARDLTTEETLFTTSGTSLLAEFTSNTDTANAKYLEKAIAVFGTITSISATDITIDNSIVCTLKTADTSLQKNQKVTAKGRVVGFDDLMGELKLDQCFIIKN
jgi:flagellar motor component MotA